MKRRTLVVISSLLFLLPCVAEAADQFFDSNGVKIRYIAAGSGEPIILIHPFAACAEIWEPLVKDLSQNYQLIAIDCRGHGKSENPAGSRKPASL
jgi:pimeloyl-ACP methyl ester carboxylesterase